MGTGDVRREKGDEFLSLTSDDTDGVSGVSFPTIHPDIRGLRAEGRHGERLGGAPTLSREVESSAMVRGLGESGWSRELGEGRESVVRRILIGSEGSGWWSKG